MIDFKMTALLCIVTLSVNCQYTLSCKAAEKNYAEKFIMKGSASLMSNCALGSLMNLDLMSRFDPLGKLFDGAEKRICGVVRDITNPYIDAINDGISDYNDLINSVDYSENQYAEWVDSGFNEAYEGRSGSGYREAFRSPPATEHDWPELPDWPRDEIDESVREGQEEYNSDPKDDIVVAPDIGDGSEVETPRSNTEGRLIKRGKIIGDKVNPIEDWDEIYRGITQ